MSEFYPSRFVGISWFRVFLSLGMSALVFVGCVFHEKMIHWEEDIDEKLRDQIRRELKCERYTTEEAQLVSFLATTILQERQSQEAYTLHFILDSVSIYGGGSVLEMAGTTERKEIGAALFSRLLDSGEAEIAFVAYVFWFDWLMAEKEGICSREETDEALRSLVDSFNADSPSDTLSLGLKSLQKLKNRVENSEGSFGFTWPEALLDPDRPFPHKSCFPKREMMPDAPSS